MALRSPGEVDGGGWSWSLRSLFRGSLGLLLVKAPSGQIAETLSAESRPTDLWDTRGVWYGFFLCLPFVQGYWLFKLRQARVLSTVNGCQGAYASSGSLIILRQSSWPFLVFVLPWLGSF